MEIDLLIAIYINIALLILLVIVYLFDINYFIRVPCVYLSAYFIKKPLNFLDASEIYGRVLPFDSDVQLWHMNNARVLREFDFGRLDLWTRIGLLDDHMKNLRTFTIRPVYAVASVIRYRRPLHMFVQYKIITRIAYWEGRVVYQEQKIVTVNDNITRNLGYSKVVFPFNLDNFVRQRYPNVLKPTPPKDLELWMKYIEANGMNTQVKSDTETECKEHEESEGWSSSSST